jgi:Protein of unknown function (DUF4239)
MPLVNSLLWSTLIAGGITIASVAGALLVRRWASVEVLERHNEVAGFIYAVIGVLYAVVLGFTAVIVWQRFDEAQATVGKEANVLGDLFRDAQAFPTDVRQGVETTLRSYAGVVVEKEWPAMAEGKSSPEARDALNRIWQVYYRFKPQSDFEKVWYSESLTKLNQLGDHRRARLLSSETSGLPAVTWDVLIGAGLITIAFSFLFGTRNVLAQAVMTAGLAMTIALVMLSIVALEQPFAGITRIQPEAFNHIMGTFDWLSDQRIDLPR